MFGEYGNGFNQYPPMQQQSQYPFIQQKPAQLTPLPAYTVCSPYQSYGNYGGCNGCC